MKLLKKLNKLRSNTRHYGKHLIAVTAVSFCVSCATKPTDTPFRGGFAGDDFVFTAPGDVLVTEGGVTTNVLRKAGAWATYEIWQDK